MRRNKLNSSMPAPCSRGNRCPNTVAYRHSLPNPRLLLAGGRAPRPAAGYVCGGGGGRRRPPQQKRRALGGNQFFPTSQQLLVVGTTPLPEMGSSGRLGG